MGIAAKEGYYPVHALYQDFLDNKIEISHSTLEVF